MLPTGVQEAGFRRPAHGESFAAVQHPRPVYALVNLRGEILDFLIGKILASGKDAAKQQGSVYGGQLAFFPAPAGFHVDEMEEEAVFVLEVVCKKAKGVADAGENVRGRGKTAMVADAQARQAESSCGGAGHGALVISIGESA